MNRFLVLAALFAFASNSFAHEIKVLASQQAVAEAGAKVTVYLSWGHRVPVDELVDAAAIESFDLHAPDGTKAALKVEGLTFQANATVLKTDGVYRAAVARKRSVSTYVIDKDGERTFKRGGKSSVTEGTIDTAQRSAQCGQAIIVVGKPSVEPLKPLGMGVEIVPVDAPAKWTANTDLKFQVLVDGKPQAGVEVQARPIGFKPDDAWSYATHADKKGIATVRPDRAATWVLKANVKRPAAEADRKEFDHESFTATLSLEVGP